MAEYSIQNSESMFSLTFDNTNLIHFIVLVLSVQNDVLYKKSHADRC